MRWSNKTTMHATAGRPPRNFQVVCSRPPGIWKLRHAIWRSQSCFWLPSVFTLVSNEHISKVAKRLVQLTHKPNIEQQLIWAGHLSRGGVPTDFDVYFHKMGGGEFVRRMGCRFENNLLSILMEVKVYLLGILWKRKFTSKKSFLWEDEKVLKYLSRSKKKQESQSKFFSCCDPSRKSRLFPRNVHLPSPLSW